MTNKDELLKESLFKFFKNKKNLSILENAINKKTKYSLRLVEWFISNYSKKYKTKYNVKSSNKDYLFEVYDSYKNEQLKSFSKKHFDLFRRSEKFKLNIAEDRYIETTVGQMNFFKWAIQNKILDYVEKNIDAIKKDMETRNKKLDTVVKKKKFFESIVINRDSIILCFE